MLLHCIKCNGNVIVTFPASLIVASRFALHLYCQYRTSSIDVPEIRKISNDKIPATPPRLPPNKPPTAIPRRPIFTLYRLPVTVPAVKYS